MPKSRVNVTLSPKLLRQVDRNVENRSELIEELLRKWADMEKTGESELVNQRDKIKNELSDVKEERNKLEERISDLEDELDAVEYALEQKDEESDNLEEAAEAIAPEWKKLRKKTHDPEKAFDQLWISEKFGIWDDQISASSEELKERVKSLVEEKYEGLL